MGMNEKRRNARRRVNN